ncbi:hypothetical protein ILUMI_25579 [Ignelater luminosus]|uniref:BED-type domain-containing protein n=1 Tax=Ignelater luminosus TaxID=2038154 RepID=A0A8K0C5A9_IGNLU|nr:hypothetical protein ILUMI_25579 [Ignelater luminosus]
MKSDRRRSIVWNYFRKSADNKFVKCLFCSKSMRYFRNTTNLRLHLGRMHFDQVQNTDLTVENDTPEFTACKLETLEPLPVTFEIVSPESPSTSQPVVTEIEANCEKQEHTRTRSFVWNYFTKTIDNEFVICNLCSKTLKFSHNTSNLRQHLKSRHFIEPQETETVNESEAAVKYISETEIPEETHSIAYEIREVQEEADNQAEGSEIVLKIKSSSKTSFVWNYFNKSTDGKFVTCSLCDKVLRYFRNTTNLRAHLRSSHSNEFRNECLAEENSQEHEISELSKLEMAKEETARKLKIKKSIVWNYFKRDLNRNCAVCILCRKAFKVSNTTNLKDHLNRAHPNYTRKNKLPVIKTETSYSPAPKRMRLENYNATTLSDHKIKDINNSMITMLVTSYQSFSLIENQGFLEYSKKLQPLYTPPSKEQLLSTALPEFYSASVSELKMILELVESVSISIDAWTTNANRSYLTITCHFIYEDKLYDYVLATKEVFNVNCMENILPVLLSVFNEWKIFDKIVAVVSNDVNNIRKCMNILPKPYQSCVAHMLNTAISDALVADENLLKLLEKCRALVNYFKHAPLVSEKLENIQQQMKLPLLKVKMDRGSWYSRYFMMKRLLEIRDPLCITLTDLSKVPQFLDTSEWNVVSDCFSLLEPFELIVTELLYEKYPTMSLIIPLIRGLHYSLKSKTTQTEIGGLLKERLFSLTNYYLDSLESNKIAAKATFLDPRFKTLAFGSEDTVEYVQKWIEEELLEIMGTNDVSNSESSAQNESKESSFIWAYFDTKIAQRKSSATPFATITSMITQYLEMSNLERSKNWLEFWNDHKTIFPELYQIAMKYLCVPAAAVPPERLFSRHGRLSDTFRSCLPSKSLDQIIFLNSYLNRQESSTSRETLPNTDHE